MYTAATAATYAESDFFRDYLAARAKARKAAKKQRKTAGSLIAAKTTAQDAALLKPD